MKRIKQLIKDHKSCWGTRKSYYIKWNVKVRSNDFPACSFFLIPTIEYATYPYRTPGWFVFNIYFLHWYISIGKWCNKEDTNGI